MAYLRAGDTLSGKEGKATAVINGNVHDMFYIKSLEAILEKNKTEVKALGKRGTQNKSTGWTGTGSCTMYYMTSLFRKMAVQYAKNGKDTYFDLTVENDDPGSTVGKQTIVLYGVNFDSTVLAKLDVDSDVLEEDVDFTFADVDILDEFGNPVV